MRRHPGSGEHESGRDAEQSARVVGQHDILAGQAAQVAVGLDDRGALAALRPDPDLAHQLGRQRGDYCLSVNAGSRTTRAPNTELKQQRIVGNGRTFSASADQLTRRPGGRVACRANSRRGPATT